jgi:LCP family protein required for cell wall assembly
MGLLLVAALSVGSCSGNDPVAGETVPSTSQPVTSDASPTTSSTSIPITPAPTTTSSTTTTTTTQPPRFWDGLDRLNILLLGSDAGVGRTGTRTDTMILVSIDPQTGDGAMFSIPRNLTEAPLPDGMGIWDCHCFPDILTHLWANAEWYPDAFPGPQQPSVNALKAAVGLIFDLDVQYYAKVDLEGYVAMIDAVGGVTIDVPERIVDESYPHELGGSEYVIIEAGTQHLDGHLALAYSRTRRHSGDFARMHRQRCVLGALLDQTDLDDLAAGAADLAAAYAQHVDTDIPVEVLPDLLVLLSRMDLDHLATLRITAYNYGSSGHPGYQLYDLESIRRDAHVLLADPTTHLDTQDGDGFRATCELSFD